MKTMRIAVLAVVGIALAGPAGAVPSISFEFHSSDRREFMTRLDGPPRSAYECRAYTHDHDGELTGWNHRFAGTIGANGSSWGRWSFGIAGAIPDPFVHGSFIYECNGRNEDGTAWRAGGTHTLGDRPPEPEPETPTPPPSAPEPGTSDPETPSEPAPEACPVERCDHLAIVPTMPRALSGDEGSPDHWLHVVNPGAASIRFTIEGRDMAGTKAGTYRRELPAYRGVRVNMRDIEAAFDVSKPSGWWRLVVTGSGPLEVVATMRQGDERRFVPVRVPATCGAE